MIITISILSALLLIAGAIIYNLLTKNEKLEDMVVEKDKLIRNFLDTVNFIDTELKKVDDKGAFKSDDEIGFFFKRIQDLQNILNSYFKK